MLHAFSVSVSVRQSRGTWKHFKMYAKDLIPLSRAFETTVMNLLTSAMAVSRSSAYFTCSRELFETAVCLHHFQFFFSRWSFCVIAVRKRFLYFRSWYLMDLTWPLIGLWLVTWARVSDLVSQDKCLPLVVCSCRLLSSRMAGEYLYRKFSFLSLSRFFLVFLYFAYELHWMIIHIRTCKWSLLIR